MSLKDVLDPCGAEPGERFQLASLGARGSPPTCAAFNFPGGCAAGDAWAAAESTAGRNVYLCGNPMRPDAVGDRRMSSDDVAAARLLLLDFDPEKSPDDPEGLDPKKRAACAEAATAAATATGGAHVDSGRGRQVWVRHEPGVDRKALLRALRGKFERDGTKVDSTWTPNFLMRLPGYPNTRTGEIAKIVTPPTKVLSATEAATFPAPDEDEVEGELPPADFGPHDPALVQRRVKDVWNDPKCCADRSKRDALLVLEALRAGATEAAACRLLYAMPGSKAKEDKRGEGYWRSTIKWALTERERELRLRREVEALEPGNARDPESIEKLAKIQEADLALYEQTIDRLKKVIRVGPIEAEVKRARKRLARERAPENLDAACVRMRHAQQDARSVGWWIRQNDEWVAYPFTQFRAFVDGCELPSAKVVAHLVERGWTLVNEPFQPEDLPGRRWNVESAQLAYEPKPGPHPTWDQVFRVCGRGLDGAVRESEWCRRHGVLDGATYLRLWVANAFQRPKTKLPWIFLFGDQKVGKSTFHEVLTLLLRRGKVIANEALENRNGFNGEIAGAVLCVVDELEISRKALKKLKLWTTGEQILVHRKGVQPYEVVNTTHWIQTGEKIEACPVLQGDTRITAIHVVAAEGADRASKDDIFRRCRNEAAAVTHTLLTLALPPMEDRLGVPALATTDKLDQQRVNRDALERWLEDTRPGWLTFDDEALVKAFRGSLSAKEAYDWDPERILREMPNRARVERRLVLGLLGLLKRRSGGLKLRVAEILDKLPQCRGDWASIDAAAKFLRRPGLPWETRSVKIKGQRVLKLTLSTVGAGGGA